VVVRHLCVIASRLTRERAQSEFYCWRCRRRQGVVLESRRQLGCRTPRCANQARPHSRFCSDGEIARVRGGGGREEGDARAQRVASDTLARK
jgi:hypothetical protein